jgi:hypothetical protein
MTDRSRSFASEADARAWIANPDTAPSPAPPAGALRDQIAEALRAAVCPGDCGKTEDECCKTRLQPVVWRHGKLDGIDGSPELIADAVLPVIERDRDRRAALHADTERRLRADLAAEVRKREAAEQQLASVRGLADDLRGVTGARYIANALDKILNSKEAKPMSTCTATVTGPHVPDGGTAYCTRDAGHEGHHIGPASDVPGDVHWTDHHAGATPHDPEISYSTEPPVDDTPPQDVSDFPPR